MAPVPMANLPWQISVFTVIDHSSSFSQVLRRWWFVRRRFHYSIAGRQIGHVRVRVWLKEHNVTDRDADGDAYDECAARTKLQDATDWAPLTCKLWSVCEPCSELQTLDSGALRPGAKSLTQEHRPDIQSHDNSSSRWALFFAYIVRCVW